MLRIATRSLVTALVLAAVIFPAGALAKTEFSASSAATQAPQVHQAAVGSQDFRWRDAGIGAGAVLALLAAGVGVTLVARRRRHHLTPVT
jgi:hypothetical protein